MPILSWGSRWNLLFAGSSALTLPQPSEHRQLGELVWGWQEVQTLPLGPGLSSCVHQRAAGAP